jgi:putative PIN family toxin of toxin-antitoxin system
MTPVQVVIDTNVLVSAWRSRNGSSFRLVESFISGDGRWEWNVSTAMLLEYEEVLLREGFDSVLVSKFLDDVATRANRTVIYFLTRPALLDADDDFVLDLAVASGSQAIVTFNVRDFVMARSLGISILAPKAFLATIASYPPV